MHVAVHLLVTWLRRVSNSIVSAFLQPICHAWLQCLNTRRLDLGSSPPMIGTVRVVRFQVWKPIQPLTEDLFQFESNLLLAQWLMSLSSTLDLQSICCLPFSSFAQRRATDSADDSYAPRREMVAIIPLANHGKDGERLADSISGEPPI